METKEEKRKVKQIEKIDEKGQLKYVIIPNYRIKDNMLTHDEIKLYKCLKEIFENTDIVIFSQVALGQILEINNKRKKTALENRIFRKNIDFVLYNIKTEKIMCCIELNGSIHKDKEKQERDVFLDECFEYTEIPLIFINNQKYYYQEQIKKLIKDEITKKIDKK